MNIVIIAGCPSSGWEIVLPILQQSGLELAGADVNRLLDKYFQKAGAGDSLQIRQPLQPDSSLGGDVATLLPDNPSSPVLLADSRNIWLLDFWAEQFPRARFLLFYTRAETALAYVLQQEVEPLQFLVHWQAANRQLLQFHRRHRQRTLLLDVEAVSLHHQALETACRRIGLMLKPAANFPTPAIALSPMERLLAKYLLSTQPEVQLLQMELEASSQPLGEIVPKIELQPDEVIDSFRQGKACQHNLQQQMEQAQQNSQQMEASRQGTVQENELLLLQLHQVQEELEQAQQNFQQMEASRQETDQKNELLLLQLHQVQEELEATFLLKQQIEQAQKQQAAERQKLSIQLEQAQQTLQKHETTHRETAQENELLLLQLHQVQEELEHYFIKYQDITDERQRELQAKDGETDKSRLRKKVSQILSWNIAVQPITRLFKKTNKNKERKIIQKQVDWLKTSGLFDETWYLSAHPDVANAGIDPVKHYLCHGAAEGRNPSPWFDTRAYLATNPDVAATGMNPLVHYGKFGKAEGRLLHKRGNATWK